MEKNKQGAIWAGAALMAIIVGVLTYAHNENKKRPTVHKPIVATTAPSPVETKTALATTTLPLQIFPEATSTPPSATSTPIAKTPYRHKKIVSNTPAPLSYGEAVAMYSNHRIQFNSLCQGIPGQTVLANHVTIMLDNRSDSPQKITLAGQTYTVAAYNYVLAVLNQKTLPATLHVGCNSQMNAVEIVVE